MKITASKLYNYTQCKHRVWRDANGPQAEKNPEDNPFVKLLWERGVSYEKEVVAGLEELTDLSEGTMEERFKKTLKAISEGKDLIYQGVLIKGDERGIPDLLKKMPDGAYVPIDIKSGLGFEGGDEEGDGEVGKPKIHYAVQLCFYIDLMDQLGIKNTDNGAVIDITGEETVYDLDSKRGPRMPLTMREEYREIKGEVLDLINNRKKNKPAISGKCKMCPWYKSCKDWCQENKDLTNLFYVGMSTRDVINNDLNVERLEQVCDLDINEIMSQKKRDKDFLRGVGEGTLSKMIERAEVLKSNKPKIAEGVSFPDVKYELFFDIEADPTQDFVYMHGIYERGPEGKRYVDFTAREISPTVEKKIWVDFWEYIKSLPKDDFAVYYYSAYEKGAYNRLQKKYPEVISKEDLDAFFENENVIDLYNKIILKQTEWPLCSYSIKEIAVFLGFKWRDNTPSGALSIEWFNKFVYSKDEDDLKRILMYNEDDCKATMVIKDYLANI